MTRLGYLLGRLRRVQKLGLVMVLSFTLLVPGTIRGEETFEVAPTLAASKIIPNEVVGPRYRVREDVANDGYMNTYRIDSDFGPFEAYGTRMLSIRLLEMGALSELDELSKSKVFVDAVSNAAMGQVTAVKDFTTHPVETVKGVPGGVKRMFKRVKRGVDDVQEKTGSEDEEGEEGEEGEGKEKSTSAEAVEASQKYAKKYFGVTGAQRRWAEKLGVDPYTSNEVLRREIKKVAKVDAAGGFSVRLAPIPRIPGVSYVRGLNKLVWSVDPRELVERNMKALTAVGAEPELVTRFFENPWYSPSLQTYLVASVVELESVAGREVVVGQAADAESEEEAMFFVQAMRMLATFHGEEPVARLLGGARIPAALTADNRLVFLIPADYVSWTEGIAAAAEGPFREVGTDLRIEAREVRFLGGVSERCRQELEDRGWTVHERYALTVSTDEAES